MFNDMHTALGTLKLMPANWKHLDYFIPFKLSPREEQILFLLILGQSPKYIANFLSKQDKPIKDATVTAIINKKLYLKFNVHNTPELIMAAIALKYFNKMPSFTLKRKKICNRLTLQCSRI